MKILYSNNDLNEALKHVKNLGFVPTMGSLHRGHLSLVRSSMKRCKKTLVSIFINPTQFNNEKDYKNYPQNIKKDLLILKKLNVDFVYIPSQKQVYSLKKKSKIKIDKRNQILCAKFRKGHFEGVLDVMERLTNLVKPKKIFMGEKDFQQLYLVKNNIKKKIKGLIVPCKTIRDENKLALSSRNIHLNKKELLRAGKLAQHLISFKKKLVNKKKITNLINIEKKYLNNIFNIKIEYLELRNKLNLKRTNKVSNSRLFIAYYLKKIRLIDNF
jgi:pantoate--beta-alanine ligase